MTYLNCCGIFPPFIGDDDINNICRHAGQRLTGSSNRASRQQRTTGDSSMADP